MAGVNKVILIGNLGADPEIRNLPSGASVANFNMATSETYTNKNGEKVTQTEWHRVECWEGLAKIAEQYLRKGSSVYIEGKIRTEEWQDKDGNTRYTTRIRAQNMTMLGGRPDSANGGQEEYGNNRSESGSRASGSQPEPNSFSDEGADDDLPF
ncbi:single-stranded DNA-binding protein [Nafulsella turpanensis]|uniref:single-stranded DNA-binding protein n=1 Tax=Nafulsella turpanensis TaxID=1265690 RepID=UPI00034CAE5B|nr:single-stranded DNA-binding protein [Nafulsella turpanensis]